MDAHRPNFLMICCDQLRYDAPGFAGPNAALGRPALTPNIDGLARRGVWMENAYSALPTCCPARQCMLAGKRPETFGALWNYDITSKVPSLRPEMPTWSAALHQAGYRMEYVGKWHVSPDHDPTHFGYDHWCSDSEYAAWRREHHPDCALDHDYWGCTDPVPTEDTHTHYLTARAVDRLRELAAGEGPWHLRLDLSEPHLPCQPCEEFARRYAPEDTSPWPSFSDDLKGKPYVQTQQLWSWDNEDKTWADWSRYVARYFAVVSQVDDAVGRLLTALEETGQAEDTYILFCADHGDMCGSHRMMDKHYVLYDDTVRVPTVWAGPGIAPRREAGFVNASLDMAATVCDLLGVPCFVNDGLSYAPALRGEPEELRDYAVSSFNGQQFGLFTQRMYRTARWKYIWNLTDVDELYHLSEDPWEMHNLARDPACGEILRDLRLRLFEVLKREDPDVIKTVWPRRQLLDGKKV